MNVTQDVTRKEEAHKVKSKESQKVEELCKDLDPSDVRMLELAKKIESAINRGGKNTSVKCLPTHISSLPSGEECGRFLSLELTTSSVKVCLIDIKASSEGSSGNPSSKVPMEVSSKEYDLHEKLKTSNGEKLFGRLAECLREFIQKEKLEETQLLLAFTFPFAVDQESLTKGELINWSKGFSCSGVVGEDVVQLLKDSFRKAGLGNIEVHSVKCQYI